MKIIDNNGKVYNAVIKDEKIILKKEEINQVQYIEFMFEEFSAEVGEEGYYVIADAKNCGSQLCFFNKKDDEEHIFKQNLMPIMGIKKKEQTVLMIVEGMKNEFYVRAGIKEGKYYIAARFVLDGDPAYEDILFIIHGFENTCDYNDMGAYYRDYQINKGVCVPIKERIKNNPFLEYATESIEIRIRMGWKEAPPKILEQAVENEPEMKVACTFEQVKKIIDELKTQGVDKAQICLVGWNVSGHDGRYPQIFPVEEKLGGEQKLRELIEYAQINGYQIVCHTNSTDCYSIADCFSDDIVVKEKDGNLSVNECAYSGGRMYNLCPVKAYEYAEKDLPKVQNLGFKGIHYIDVMSVIPLRKCYDKNHFLTSSDTEHINKNIGNLAKKLFGGFASEGGCDFAASYLDYALYITCGENKCNLFDREIPLWQIVYHGIILSNPSRSTLNYIVKDEYARLKFIEYGGRPAFYFNSKFLENTDVPDWLEDDLFCSDDEQIMKSVSKIKKAYDEYKKMDFLQKEFIVKYDYDNDFCSVEYSDGTKIKIDLRNKYAVMEVADN